MLLVSRIYGVYLYTTSSVIMWYSAETLLHRTSVLLAFMEEIFTYMVIMGLPVIGLWRVLSSYTLINFDLPKICKFHERQLKALCKIICICTYGINMLPGYLWMDVWLNYERELLKWIKHDLHIEHMYDVIIFDSIFSSTVVLKSTCVLLPCWISIERTVLWNTVRVLPFFITFML